MAKESEENQEEQRKGKKKKGSSTRKSNIRGGVPFSVFQTGLYNPFKIKNKTKNPENKIFDYFSIN